MDQTTSEQVGKAIGHHTESLADLIERLAMALGSDRILDRDIGVAVLGWFPCTVWGRPFLKIDGNLILDCPIQGDYPSPTESIDAALTLVPAGWTWLCGDGGVMEGDPGDQRYGAVCFKAGRPDQQAVGGSNAAIALCIAALKARADR